MQVSEVSETGVWMVSENGRIFCQTLDQTVARHLAVFSNKYNDLKVSDKVSDTVWHPSKCPCLTGGVSLGRATPDTQTKSRQKGVFL